MSTMKRSFKRRFEPSISSDLGHASDTQSPPTAPRLSLLCPTLPGTIQSSLINVGLRVRKSIPEGYKTRPKTFCGSYASYNATQSERSSYHGRSASTGVSSLAPYCGIFKIGAHEMQMTQPEDELTPLLFDRDDLSLPSSQESYVPEESMNAPILIPFVGNNKRRREDADDEDFDPNSPPVSPRSRPISHTRMPNLDQIRLIALPKTRKRLPQTIYSRESEMLDVGDFGEAQFFKPDEWGQDWMQSNEF